MKVPVISSILNGIVKAIKALNCKCKSSCCESECIQTRKRSSQEIHDYSQTIGRIEKVTEL